MLHSALPPAGPYSPVIGPTSGLQLKEHYTHCPFNSPGSLSSVISHGEIKVHAHPMNFAQCHPFTDLLISSAGVSAFSV